VYWYVRIVNSEIPFHLSRGQRLATKTATTARGWSCHSNRQSRLDHSSLAGSKTHSLPQGN